MLIVTAGEATQVVNDLLSPYASFVAPLSTPPVPETTAPEFSVQLQFDRPIRTLSVYGQNVLLPGPDGVPGNDAQSPNVSAPGGLTVTGGITPDDTSQVFSPASGVANVEFSAPVLYVTISGWVAWSFIPHGFSLTVLGD